MLILPIWPLIHIIAREMTLPVTPKGNVRRKEAEKLFSEDIARLYRRINEDQLLNGAEDSQTHSKNIYRIHLQSLQVYPHNMSRTGLRFTILVSILIWPYHYVYLSPGAKKIGIISLGTIFENPSVESLVAFAQEREQAVIKESRSQVISQIISKLTAQV